jgi:hypothetical protein
MAPSAKKARTSAAPTAASTGSHSNIDATHAEHLARHLADLYKCGRFTDLQVRHRNESAFREGAADCSARRSAPTL